MTKRIVISCTLVLLTVLIACASPAIAPAPTLAPGMASATSTGRDDSSNAGNPAQETLIALEQSQTEVALQQMQAAIQQTQTAIAQPATAPPPPPPTVAPPTFVPPPPPQPFFQLINRHTQMCLTARGVGAPVVQESCGNGRDDQLWNLPPGDTQFSVQSRSGVCVGYDPAGHFNTLFGVGCSTYRPWAFIPICAYAQCFSAIVSPHGHALVPPVEQGEYYLIQYQNDCIDVDGWNHNEGGTIIHDTCRGENNDNQLWARH